MTSTLTQLPRTSTLYWEAALSVMRRPGALKSLPPLSLRLSGVRTEAARLADYCALCGLTQGPVLPITFPQVAVNGLHMALMTLPKFPLPLLGLVHVSNRIEQHRPIPVEAVYDAEVRIGDSREVRAGLEFDLLTDVEVDGERVWSAVTTLIYRRPSPRQDGPKRAEKAVPPSLAQYAHFIVEADTGRRYAAVSGDYNPIHLHAWSARVFGFPRAIAHGMWSAARCLGALEAQCSTPPTTLEVQFKQPLLLPGRVTLKWVPVIDDQLAFTLLSPGSGKVHLTGMLR
jgi:acyl dehydratase